MTQGETEHEAGATAAPPARTLFAVLGGAVAWAIHFLASYAIVAVGCVAGWSRITLVIWIVTLGFLAVALWSTVIAWREWRRVGDQPWDMALSEPRGWYAWLMTAGVLMGATSAIAILLEALGSLLLPVCGWDVR